MWAEPWRWSSDIVTTARVVGDALIMERRMPRPIRVLELRSVWGTGGGPEKTILLGAARSDPARYKVTVCYIRDRRDVAFRIDDRARDLSVDYLEVCERHSFDFSVWPALRRVIRSRGIDIVHAHDYKTDLLGLLLGRAEGVVPLATAHGWAGTGRRERFYYYFDRRLLARYPIAIAVSERIRQTLIAHGADPSRVRRIRNGIDHRYFKRRPDGDMAVRVALSLPHDALIIGGVGRLEREKRFDLLLEAVVRMQTDRPPIIVIAGEGSCRRDLEERARVLGTEGRLRLLGLRNDVREVHQSFDVYVQTSDTEGIPNAVLEAMAVETPVVATDVGGTSELIDHGVHGLLVPRRDPDALARAIEYSLRDRGATARRVAAARARVEDELSFDLRMTAVESVYEELMGRAPPAVSSR